MNIKEIALRLAHRKCTSYYHVPSDMGIKYRFAEQHLIDFATALLAELSKDAAPVAEGVWFDPELRHFPETAGKIIDGSLSFMDSASLGTKLYTHPQPVEAKVAELDAAADPEALHIAYLQGQSTANETTRKQAARIVELEAEVARLKDKDDACDEAWFKIDELRQQLAASQAREKGLRDALAYYTNRMVTKITKVAENALDAPTDDTALREYCAAEVEKIAAKRLNLYPEFDVLIQAADDIRKGEAL